RGTPPRLLGAGAAVRWAGPSPASARRDAPLPGAALVRPVFRADGPTMPSPHRPAPLGTTHGPAPMAAPGPDAAAQSVTGPLPRPVAAGWPTPQEPARTRPATALVVTAAALLAGVLGALASLAVLGGYGAGWTGGVLFAASALAVAGLCLLSLRARPVRSRFRGRDELTGLAGRRAFLDAAARVVGGGEHRVREVSPAALVLVNLDRFREINSVLGHQSGDRLLVVVASRLRELLRPSDLLARIGGDEFAVLLRDAGPGRAELLANRLRDALRAPVLLADLPVQTEVSVGIAYAPAHGRGAAELLRHAEAAMYEAKLTRVGQRTYQRNRHTAAAPGRARLRLRAELRSALEDNQIELRYQPKADPRTGRVTGVEALVRWQHPREGLRGPGVFLPEMEQAGLMPALTRRVLELALADCASWRGAGAELSVSVNVPPSVIDDTGFAAVVEDALSRHRLEPSALVVEVTEEALITVREQARRTLAELRALGVRVSLDDYGTGFCSLAYLRELPADEVKLDQMFLRDMHRDPSAAEIVRSTVALAHALDLKIVAEGVETKGAWLALAGWRCDEVQGYFVSPPLAGGRVVSWLEDWARRVSRQSQSQPSPPDPAASARPASTKADPAKVDPAKAASVKADPAKAPPVKPNQAKQGQSRASGAKAGPLKPGPAKGDPAPEAAASLVEPTPSQPGGDQYPAGTDPAAQQRGARTDLGAAAARAGGRGGATLVPAQPGARPGGAARTPGPRPRVGPRSPTG
ncbi:bifunctional diguanylate cyclase/phosphodiesterase, partial [Frankia sp. AgB1.8]|uniref:putative bifunctional diguanylate cyclase/phosphodiesterase n=2 Tax=unclassified Frankia TaxID=2632575 RepID=UPI0019317FA0